MPRHPGADAEIAQILDWAAALELRHHDAAAVGIDVAIELETALHPMQFRGNSQVQQARRDASAIRARRHRGRVTVILPAEPCHTLPEKSSACTVAGRKCVTMDAGSALIATASAASTKKARISRPERRAPARAGAGSYRRGAAKVMLALTTPGRAARSTVIESIARP